MARPVLIELLLFLVPFAVFAIYLFATRGAVFDADAWTLRILVWLTAAAVAIVIVSLVVLAQFSGGPPDSTYEPARMEDGKFVPGRVR